MSLQSRLLPDSPTLRKYINLLCIGCDGKHTWDRHSTMMGTVADHEIWEIKAYTQTCNLLKSIQNFCPNLPPHAEPVHIRQAFAGNDQCIITNLEETNGLTTSENLTERGQRRTCALCSIHSVACSPGKHHSRT